MSIGGDGVVPGPIVAQASTNRSDGYLPMRFAPGGRISVSDHPAMVEAIWPTCVLCAGGLFEKGNAEHPLSQWLHKFAGHVSEEVAAGFAMPSVAPSWRQLCLASHNICNTTFDVRVERPARTALIALVEGRIISGQQIDALFDWLDKVMTSSAHMGSSLQGHGLQLQYNQLSFPNYRVGYADRMAIMYRCDSPPTPLELWDCMSFEFLTTPSSIMLQVKDLIIIYVSSSFLLSDTFGLDKGVSCELVPGNGQTSPLVLGRGPSPVGAAVLVQPMRRQAKPVGVDALSALMENGDGKIFSIVDERIRRCKSVSTETVVRLPAQEALLRGNLEVTNWLIACKDKDWIQYYGHPSGSETISVDKRRETYLGSRQSALNRCKQIEMMLSNM